MAIVFESFESVKVDGVSAGSFSDCVANYSARRVELASACKAFHADLVAAHKTALDAKEAALTTVNATIITKNQEINGLDGEIQALESQVEKLTAENATKQSQLDAASATIAAFEARVALLLTELPFNARIIDASAFYERITKDEFAALSVADDETLRTIAKTILAYKTNDWPVVFESREFQGLIGYLVGTAFLTADRAAQLTADATRVEAYDAA